jgi:hypothetical protein
MTHASKPSADTLRAPAQIAAEEALASAAADDS